jgi:hypothetical protein
VRILLGPDRSDKQLKAAEAMLYSHDHMSEAVEECFFAYALRWPATFPEEWA